MALTDAQVARLLRAGLPAPDAWTKSPKGVVVGLLNGAGRAHNQNCLQYVDKFRLESNAYSCSDEVPTWEGAFGLGQSPIAQVGTPQERLAQVVAKWRERCDASLSNLQALVQPLLNYADPTKIEIIETDRTALTAAHTYPFGGTPVGIPTGHTSAAVTVSVLDGPACSQAGAQVNLTVSGYLEELSIYLLGPGGTPADSVRFGPGYLGSGSVTSQTYRLDAPEFMDRPIKGTWTLTLLSTGSHTGTLHSASLFVEGIGRDFATGTEGLGAPAHHWGLVYDSTLVAPGQVANPVGALQVLQHVKPAHTVVFLLPKGAGGLFAIPDTDTAIPDEGIPA